MFNINIETDSERETRQKAERAIKVHSSLTCMHSGGKPTDALIYSSIGGRIPITIKKTEDEEIWKGLMPNLGS